MQTRQSTAAAAAKLSQKAPKEPGGVPPVPGKDKTLVSFAHPKMCDVPFCDNVEIPTAFGDNTNILCASCTKFTCGACTTGNMQLQGQMNEIPGVQIRTFTCPFCRCSFNEWLFDTGTSS